MMDTSYPASRSGAARLSRLSGGPISPPWYGGRNRTTFPTSIEAPETWPYSTPSCKQNVKSLELFDIGTPVSASAPVVQRRRSEPCQMRYVAIVLVADVLDDLAALPRKISGQR